MKKLESTFLYGMLGLVATIGVVVLGVVPVIFGTVIVLIGKTYV